MIITLIILGVLAFFYYRRQERISDEKDRRQIQMIRQFDHEANQRLQKMYDDQLESDIERQAQLWFNEWKHMTIDPLTGSKMTWIPLQNPSLCRLRIVTQSRYLRVNVSDLIWKRFRDLRTIHETQDEFDIFFGGYFYHVKVKNGHAKFYSYPVKHKHDEFQRDYSLSSLNSGRYPLHMIREFITIHEPINI